MLPNFIVVGVSRAGTSIMFATLSRHPQVLASPTRETRYFQAVRYGEPLPPLMEYEAYFRRHAGQPVTMECTPDYFFGGLPTATAIKETCDPRVAVVLREPTSRLISFFQFLQGRLQLPASMTLRQYVQRCQAVPVSAMNERANNNYTAVWGGQYARFLPAWLSTFPDRCDVLFYDDLLTDPMQRLAEQCQRLGIDPSQLPMRVPINDAVPAYRSSRAQRVAAFAARHSRGLLPRYPRVYTTARRGYEALNRIDEATEMTVPQAVRREIEALYRPWNDLLREQLLEAGITRLPAWLARDDRRRQSA